MLLSALPAAAAEETAEKLPTPKVEWLTENKVIGEGEEARTYQAGQAIMTELPEGYPSYHMTLKDSAGNVLEDITESSGDQTAGVVVINIGWYMEEPLPSGTYTLEVYYVGSGSDYADSDVATVTYTYTKPTAGYQTPTDVTWGDDGFASFTLSDTEFGPRDDLFVQFGFFDAEDDTEPNSTRALTISPTPDDDDRDREKFEARLNDLITRCGDGYYRYRIRVLSWYITEKSHSAWSEWSEPRYVSGGDETLTGKLDEIINGLPTDTEIKTEAKADAVGKVRGLDQTALQSAMSADHDGNGVTKRLDDLETKLNVNTSINLAEDSGLSIDLSQVDVIGAGLNTEKITAPTLTIDKAPDNLSIPTIYNSVLQVDLSLSASEDEILKNEDGTLLVPIQITMPIPGSIEPEYFRILHFYNDGERREVIYPYVYQVEGQWMARFTVKQLSPFVFAEFHPYTVTFDLNGGEGTAPAAQQTDENGRLKSLPADPTRAGHTFTGWFTAKENGQKVDTSYQFTADATVYAVWQATGGGNTGGGSTGGGSTGGGSTGGTTVRPSVPEAVTEGETTTVTTGLNASLSGGTARAEVRRAVLDETVDQLLEAAAEAGTAPVAAFDLDTPAGTEGVRLNLPAQPMAELAQAAGTLRMTSPVGSLTLDGTALAAAADGAEELVLSVVPAGTEALNQAQQSAIQGQPVFDVTVLADGAAVSMPGGKLTVTVPYALAEGREPGGVVVSYLDEQGQLADCPTAYDAAAETVTFTPAHLSLYVVRYDALRLWTNPFTDVSEDDWYYDAVRYVNAGDLMTGTSSAAFAPGVTTSRAMLATLLYRLDGAPDLSGENLGYPYADVEADSWYGDGVYWARLHGVVTGVTGEIFDPDGDITREQMAVMLYRYAQYKDYDVTGSADLSGYADADSVSSWAQYAVAWAVDAGLISGVGNNTLNPQGSATRAEIATILMRFVEGFVPAE